MFRLVLVPVFIALLAAGTPGMRWAAFGVFAAASFTDQLDGAIARARGQITRFGILADPIADKALTLGAFVTFSVLGEIPWWVTIVIAVRELGITALRAVLVRRSVIPASMGGKVKTSLQMLAIVLYVIPWDSFTGSVIPGVAAGIVLYLALAVTVGTGIDYVVRGWRLWRAGTVAGTDDATALAEDE